MKLTQIFKETNNPVNKYILVVLKYKRKLEQWRTETAKPNKSLKKQTKKIEPYQSLKNSRYLL